MIEDEIKKLALEAGADLVGICSADAVDKIKRKKKLVY